jgi:hypothetical protein
VWSTGFAVDFPLLATIAAPAAPARRTIATIAINIGVKVRGPTDHVFDAWW